MSKSYAQIKREVGDAVDFVRTRDEVFDPFAPIQLPAASDLRKYAGLPLDTLINLPPNDDLTPNQVCGTDQEDFFLLYDALESITRHHISRREVRGAWKHEKYHGTASLAAGYREVRMGIALELGSDGIVYPGAFCWAGGLERPITIGAFAATYAAPPRPSEGDVAVLDALGTSKKAIHQHFKAKILAGERGAVQHLIGVGT